MNNFIGSLSDLPEDARVRRCILKSVIDSELNYLHSIRRTVVASAASGDNSPVKHFKHGVGMHQMEPFHERYPSPRGLRFQTRHGSENQQVPHKSEVESPFLPQPQADEVQKGDLWISHQQRHSKRPPPKGI